MGKPKDYTYVEGVGLFQSRASAVIYDHFRDSQQDGVTEPIEWTRLRDVLFGPIGFMEHDDYVLFEVEVINPSLAEIQKRTGQFIQVELLDSAPDGTERIRFAQRAD
ncbi:MAG: hypothetical protein H2060_03120 [Azoarcus sp.]|nr:hypothetical protein [Azoarcus sp.]